MKGRTTTEGVGTGVECRIANKVRIMGTPGKSLGDSGEITWEGQSFSWKKAAIFGTTVVTTLYVWVIFPDGGESDLIGIYKS